MQPIATDQVAWSVINVSPAKVADPVIMPFGMWTQVSRKNRVLDGVQIPTHEGAILTAKRGGPRTFPD